jgi:transposase
MWTNENRHRYDRSKLRYPSDLSDEEWALIEPEIPPAKRGGGKRTVNLREVVNGLMYVLSTGCQWRAIPKDLPPRSTVNGYFSLWDYDGTLGRIHHALYVKWLRLVKSFGRWKRTKVLEERTRGERAPVYGDFDF